MLKPFLRWAGGKTWLSNTLIESIQGLNFNNYHEPFLGGGAIFLALSPENQSFLSDLNKELILTYQTLRDSPEEVIEVLKSYTNTEDFYYEIRATEETNSVRVAARFIFLNQTSFNGIYRVNLDGKYNVPYGHRKKNFLEQDKLRNISQRLRNVTIEEGDFEIVRDRIVPNDLVFLDPPYTVSHNNNGFIKYNQKLFSLEDQERLSDLIDHIKNVGAHYILTNAAHEKIIEIFEKGDNVFNKARASIIGGKKATRGRTEELIFTNLDITINER